MGLAEEENRIFIGTFLKNADLSKLVKNLNINAQKGFRVIPEEQIHITWKFIGMINKDENEKIFNIIKKHSPHCLPFLFDKLEIWPNLRFPKLLALTARNYDEKFKIFSNNLEEDLFNELKIKKENRKFIPHITVARFKKSFKGAKPLKQIDLKPIKVDIDHIELIESINQSGKVLYKALFVEKI